MKFSLFAILPALGLFGTSLAATAPQIVDLSKRQDYAVESSILSSLMASVITQTGAINATLAALPANADSDTKAAASTQVNAAVGQITALINAATAQVQALPAAAAVAKRQGVDIPALVAQIAALLFELSGTLNGVIAALGLTSLLAFLNPLTSGLSGLLLALTLVVDGLLAAVTLLLNAILIGLSVALAGITL